MTSYDFDDIDPGATPQSIAYASEEAAGTSTDPYLEIVYETDPGPEARTGLYTQIESPYPSEEETASWSDDWYASANTEIAYSCGRTIASCGCAITSLVMLARSEGIVTGVDGEVITPKSLDDWLVANDGYNRYGNVFWGKALDYFGVRNSSDEIETPFSLDTHNEEDMSDIQAAAIDDAMRVVGFSSAVRGGHYFVIDDYETDAYTVRDPWYYNTNTLNDTVTEEDSYVFDYNNQVTKANVVKVSDPATLTGFVEIILASPAELRIEDEAGRVTGYENGNVVKEVPSASYDQTEFIGDPAWEEDPVDPHYMKRMIVTKATGEYELQVVGTATGTYNLSVYLVDVSGHSIVEEFVASTTPGQTDIYELNVVDAAVTPTIDEPEEPEEPVVIDREEFLQILRDVTKDKHRATQWLLERKANKIFDAIDSDHMKLAHVRLRVFEKLVRAVRVQDDSLAEAIDALEVQIADTAEDHGSRKKHGRDNGRKNNE